MKKTLISSSSGTHLGAAIAILLVPAAASAAATDYFWTAAGSGDGGTASGGSGTWNTGGAFWRNDSATGTLGVYNSATTSAARFGGTAGTVTLAGSTNLNANQLVFLTPGYTVAGAIGSTITLGGATSGVSNSLGAATVSAVLAGSAGFTATGNGATTLTGTNTFTGGINIIRGQNLVLDYGSSSTVVTNQTIGLGNGTGGTLTIKGNASGTTTQNLGTLTFSFGQNTVVVDKNGGSGTTLNLGTLTRTTAGALLFDVSSGGAVTANLTGGSPVNLVNEVLVAGTTATSSVIGFVRTGTNTYDFATGSAAANGATVSALGATTELVTSGGANTNNYRVTTGKTITSNTDAGSIRVDTTTANGGTLTINSAQSLIARKNTILFDGTGDFNVAGPGSLTGNAALLVQQWSTGTVTFGNNLGFASQALSKFGTGLLVNNSTNTIGALNLFGGVYRTGGAAALSGGNITLGSGGVLELTAGSGDFTRSLGTTGTTVQFLSEGGFSASGGDRVVAIGGTGSPTPLIWNSTANFLAPGARLILGSTTSDSTVNFMNSIDFNGVQREISVGNGSAAVDAKLSGVLHSTTFAGGGLYKTGAGRLALTATNTYTGPTTVAAGTLSVEGTLSTGNVSVSGKLTGGGSIGGATTIQSAGVHNAGDIGAAGKQTFSSSLEYGSGSIFEWDLAADPATTGRGTGYDAVNTASLVGTTGAIFRVVLNGSQDFSTAFWDVTRQWTDIFKTGDSGEFLSFASIFSGGFQYHNAGGSVAGVPTTQGSFSISGSTLTWTAVPEPTGALCGLLIGAGLFRRRRASDRRVWITAVK